MNFFWRIRRRIEGFIPYFLLTHRAKIRRIIFEDIEKEKINNNSFRKKDIYPIGEKLMYDREVDDRVSSEMH